MPTKKPKTQANDPAFPVAGAESTTIYRGLTKLEYAAIAIMAGTHIDEDSMPFSYDEQDAEHAVKRARTLFEHLNL